MVLDGVLDSSLDINQVSAAQAAGFDGSLREFVKQCQEKHAKQCPLNGSVDDGMSQIREMLDSLIDNPLPARNDRELTATLAFTGLIGNMYNTATWWNQLMPALAQAINQGDGTGLLNSADFYNERNPDGTYETNSSDAFMVINALDYAPVGDMSEWEEATKKLEAEHPTVAKFFSYSSLGLDQWPVPGNPKAKRVVNPKLDEDILLVGTTGDPATPLVMAENTHKNMEHSKLLTVQGWNHTAYNSYAPGCVKNAVDTYFISGKFTQPDANSICTLS